MTTDRERLAGREVLGRFFAVLLRTPRYAVLASNLARDGRLSASQRAGAGAALGYALLPLDLLPGIIPVVGQLDDLTVLIGGLRTVLRSTSPEVRAWHLERAALTLETLDADLNTVRDTAWWIGRRGARLIGRAFSITKRLARTVGRRLGA